MRALCVSRHIYLSEHLGRFFRRLGLQTSCAVGIEGGVRAAHHERPDVVLCDYDLLATLSLESWERDERLARVPVIAVSLTRRPDEVQVLDINGIAGFLYLPTLCRDDAAKIFGGIRRAPLTAYMLPSSLDWPRASVPAPTR